MKAWKLEKLWNFKEILNNQYLEINDKGEITYLGATPQSPNYEDKKGLFIPGFQNAHSHAFQYAMVGMSENLAVGKEDDDFWSWRNLMYDLALKLSPDQLEVIAKMLYSEMLRMGYTQVAEFHYLHHDQDGKPYGKKTELSERLLKAAQEVGLRICMVPMFYQKGGFNQEPQANQIRFLHQTSRDYLQFRDEVRSVSKNYSLATSGTGIHSLRAGLQEEILTILKERTGPLHIHIAEQVKEVDQCLEKWGKRPVRWLLDTGLVDKNYFLVHATHMDDEEVKDLAQSGGQIVVCPTTEGNLGDGILPLVDFDKSGGEYCIGSDSHICLNPLEEIRFLDYAQRYQSKKRNPLIHKGGQDSAHYLLEKCWKSGRQSCDQAFEAPFKTGSSFDAVSLDLDHPSLIGKDHEHLIASAVYGSDSTLIQETIVAGEVRVHKGKHFMNDSIKKEFRKVMNKLWE